MDGRIVVPPVVLVCTAYGLKRLVEARARYLMMYSGTAFALPRRIQ